MPELSSSTYDPTDANNTSASPNGAPEAMLPSGVNDTIRAMIGSSKRFWQRIQGATASTGSANAYLLNFTPDLAALVTGERYSFRANFTNTAAPTLTIDSTAATTIKKYTAAAGKTDLVSGNIQSGMSVTVEYDGTHFILITPVAETAIDGSTLDGGSY